MTPPPLYGVLWGTRCDRQARKLSKTKSSSVVPEAPSVVHHRAYALIQVQGCSCSKLEALGTFKEHSDTVLTLVNWRACGSALDTTLRAVQRY